MDKQIEGFEAIKRVSEILNKYSWFFDIGSNQYVLESFQGDIKCLIASNYLDGLWYIWQASSTPKGYVVVPKEPTEAILKTLSSNTENARMIYKAMIEAS